MKDIWRIESNSKWLNPFGKIKTPVQWKGRIKMCHVIKNSSKAQMELSDLWKAPTWVLCQDIFSPTTQVGEQATCMTFFYNPSYLHYESKALTTMACCHSSGVDFCIYISLGEYYHKYGFEDGKWWILFYKLSDLRRLICATVLTQQNLHQDASHSFCYCLSLGTLCHFCDQTILASALTPKIIKYHTKCTASAIRKNLCRYHY